MIGTIGPGMRTWIAITAVGALSYVLRVAPLVVFGRIRAGERLERTVRHAGAAAVTALLVGAIRQSGHGASGTTVLVATVAALAVAVRGATMPRVVAAGALIYATMTAVGAIAS